MDSLRELSRKKIGLPVVEVEDKRIIRGYATENLFFYFYFILTTYSTDDVSSRIMITSTDFGRIIGKGGARVNQIKNLTGAAIVGHEIDAFNRSATVQRSILSLSNICAP